MSEETKSYIEDEILKATCPHCGDVNAFPEFTQVDAFICHGCNEPVKVLAVAALLGEIGAHMRIDAMQAEHPKAEGLNGADRASPSDKQ